MSLLIRLAWSVTGTAALALLGAVLLSAEERVVVWKDGCPQCGSTVVDGAARYVVDLDRLSVSVGVEARDGGLVAVDLVVVNGADAPVTVTPGRVRVSVPRGRSGQLDRFNAAPPAPDADTLGVMTLEPGGGYAGTAWFRSLDPRDRRLLVRIPVDDLVIEFPVLL